MKCVRCGETGAERQEMRLQSTAIVVMYLCEKCAESTVRDDDEVVELVGSPGW